MEPPGLEFARTIQEQGGQGVLPRLDRALSDRPSHLLTIADAIKHGDTSRVQAQALKTGCGGIRLRILINAVLTHSLTTNRGLPTPNLPQATTPR